MLAPADLIALLLVVATWVSFLWFRYLRTARTIAYLVVATALYLGADFAPDPWPLLLRVGVAASVLALHLKFNSVISAFPREVLDFWDAYTAINRQLTMAYGDFEKSGEREAIDAALVQGLAELRAVQPPSGENWERLKAMAVDVVSERLEMLRRGTDTQTGAALRFRTHRAEVHRQLQKALEESRRFWR